MTTRDYLRALRRGWPLLTGALLLCVAAAVAANMLLPAKYTARLSVYVSATSASTTDNGNYYQGGLLAQQRVPSYRQLVTDRRVTADVIDALDLATTPEALADRIVVTNEPDTVVLDISVTDESPEQAAAIANAVADEFADLVADLEQPTEPTAPPVLTARAVEEAQPPLAPSSPRPWVNIALGVVAGVVLGVALALLRSAATHPPTPVSGQRLQRPETPVDLSQPRTPRHSIDEPYGDRVG